MMFFSRYRENSEILKHQMGEMGFKPTLNYDDHPQSYLVTAFRQPKNSRFIFGDFYERLSEKGV